MWEAHRKKRETEREEGGGEEGGGEQRDVGKLKFVLFEFGSLDPRR